MCSSPAQSLESRTRTGSPAPCMGSGVFNYFQEGDRRMKGIVNTVALSKSGKSYQVQIGGQGYFAKLDSKLDKAVGQAIDFFIDPSEYKGKVVNWVKDWDRTPSRIEAASAASERRKPRRRSARDTRYMPFISN